MRFIRITYKYLPKMVIFWVKNGSKFVTQNVAGDLKMTTRARAIYLSTDVVDARRQLRKYRRMANLGDYLFHFDLIH